MPNALIECIPNFSEARRPEVVEEIIAAIKSVKGISILDRHSDLDHNRTVITLIGQPESVEEAAFLAIQRAAALINLDEHVGAHPRIGATDVVPFVPISGISMQECVEIARRLGKRVGDQLEIPIYLYEEAATRPERVNLENIRRGQYEALKEEMGVLPERQPDFGPNKVGTAGATVIGARQPLIAYNIYLNTNDTAVAQNIAKAIRMSSGGLRYVKAMGILVEGRAQVSINLTNFRQTPIARVVETVRREALRYGTSIQHSELVGLVPQQALNDAAVWHLQLDGFSTDQILEQRLFEGVQDTQSEVEPKENSFLDALASAEPTPGGGSAAAFTGAAAAALVCMVCRVTVNKKKYETVKERMWVILDQAEHLRKELTAGVEADAQAFNAVMAAYQLPKGSPEEESARSIAIQEAIYNAAGVPLESAQHVLDVHKLAVEAAEIGNINAISDAASAATLAKAAVTCAGYNVRINCLSLNDQDKVDRLLKSIDMVEEEQIILANKLRLTLSERGGMKL